MRAHTHVLAFALGREDFVCEKALVFFFFLLNLCVCVVYASWEPLEARRDSLGAGAGVVCDLPDVTKWR